MLAIHRLLARARGMKGTFAAAFLTLALGAGSAAAAYAVLRAVYLNPLPYEESSRLVALYTADLKKTFPHIPYLPASYLRYQDWAAGARGIEGTTAWTSGPYRWTGSGRTRSVYAVRAFGSFFDTFRLRPALGAGLAAGDTAPRIVLSDAFWRKECGADPAWIGRAMVLDGQAFSVAGVLPKDLWLPDEADAVVPYRPNPEEQAWNQSRGNNTFEVAARLAPGMTLGVFRRSLAVLGDNLRAVHSEDRDWGVDAVPLADFHFGHLRPAIRLLGLAGGGLMLLAAFNLANLLLARGLGRRQEFAIRIAHGARFGHLLRALLQEAWSLVLPGLLGAVLFTWALLPILRTLLPEILRGRCAMAWDVLGVLVLACLGLTLMACLLPAIGAPWKQAASALKEGVKGSEGRRTAHVRRILAGLQAAMALLFLASAGLLLRSLQAQRAARLGFEVHHRVSFRMNFSEDPERQRTLSTQVLDTLRALPGVEGVALLNVAPLQNGGSNGSLDIPGRPGRTVKANFRTLNPGGMEVLGIPLLKGRSLMDADMNAKESLCLVSASFARAAWPDGSAVGQSLDVWDRTRTVIGIVGDIREKGARDPWPETVYLGKYGPLFGPWADLVLATRIPPEQLRPRIVAALARFGDSEIRTFASFETLREKTMGRDRTLGLMLGILGLASLGLALGGLYAVFSNDSERRSREAGIRAALGATPWRVVQSLVRPGLLAGGLGLIAGLAFLPLLAASLQSYLFGVRPLAFDVLTASLAAVSLAMLLCAWLPAARAAQRNPSDLLREE